MVQDLVPGDDATLFGYVAFWDPVGCEHSWFTRQKLRQYPTGIGNGSLQATVEAPEVADLGCGLIQATTTEVRWPESRWDERDGLYRLIEINARSAASNQLRMTAGVDIP